MFGSNNSKSYSHVIAPGKMFKLEIDRKSLNYKRNLKVMPFVKSFNFMPFGKNAIWEVTIVQEITLQESFFFHITNKCFQVRLQNSKLKLCHRKICTTITIMEIVQRITSQESFFFHITNKCFQVQPVIQNHQNFSQN